METLHENHQFYSPVTNWKSKNRRKQRYIKLNTQIKSNTNLVKSQPISPTSPNSSNKSTPPASPTSPTKPTKPTFQNSSPLNTSPNLPNTRLSNSPTLRNSSTSTLRNSSTSSTRNSSKSPTLRSSSTSTALRNSSTSPILRSSSNSANIHNSYNIPSSPVLPTLLPLHTVQPSSILSLPPLPGAPSSPLEYFPRGESLHFKSTTNVSPCATSEPISIPSHNKNNIKKVNTIHDIFSKSSKNSSPISSPISSPKVKFHKLSSYDEPKNMSSSFGTLFKSSSVKSYSKKEKNSLKYYSALERNKNSDESHTPVDNNFVEHPSFLSLRKSKTKSPIISNGSSIATLFSPTLDSVASPETETSSLFTVCTSPKSDNFLNMSNEQLFKLFPKKIIRALDSYTAVSKSEISYKKGDFFFVVSENENYYFVTNPSTKTKGYVSKFSFEQVDTFHKPKNNLSPIAETKDSQLINSQNPLTDRIMTASVTEEIITRNTHNTFPIEVTKIDGTVAVLRRSYNDICELQKSLLEYFPEDAGTNTKERILPFLPSFDSIFNHSKKTPRHIINCYLQLLTKLPNYIQFSEPFEKFFTIHKDDILSSIYVVSKLNFFNSEEEDDDDQLIKVKVIAENKHGEVEKINIIRMSPRTNYKKLLDIIEERFNTSFNNIYYPNENNEKVKLFGDEDLKLYFNSNNFSYVLWLN